jgi:hypothetical protein
MIFTIVGTMIGIMGAVFAFWERKERNRLKNVIAAEAMTSHKATGMLLGNVQAALGALQNNDLPAVTRSIDQAEGQAQILFAESIKSLWLNRGYSEKDIEKWVSHGVILPENAKFFLSYLR